MTNETHNYRDSPQSLPDNFYLIRDFSRRSQVNARFLATGTPMKVEPTHFSSREVVHSLCRGVFRFPLPLYNHENFRSNGLEEIPTVERQDVWMI